MVQQISGLQVSLNNAIGDPLQGWYQNLVTGDWYYYDAISQKWYVQQYGILIPLGIDVLPAPYQRTVAKGDTVRISISYKYVGPAVTGVKEKFVIGYKSLGVLIEKIVKEPSRNLAATTTQVTYTQTQDLVIPNDVQSNWTVIECKVHGGSPSVGEFGVRYEDALIIAGLEPTITNFTIVSFNKV